MAVCVSSETYETPEMDMDFMVVEVLTDEQLDALRRDLEHDDDNEHDGLLEVVEAELAWRFAEATGQGVV